MRKVLKYLPLLLFGVVICLAVDINYGYLETNNYPLQLPFMNEQEESEYWQKEIDRLNKEQRDQDPNEGHLSPIEGLPDIG